MANKFFIVWRHDGILVPTTGPKERIIDGPFDSLEAAKAARLASGDLIVDQDLDIVQDQSWLWDWEKNNPQSYAYRRIEVAKNGN